MPRHLLAVDAAIASTLLVLGELAYLTGESVLPAPVGIALTAGYTVPLALRRRFPRLVPVTTTLVLVAFGVLDPVNAQPTIPLAYAVAAFTLGAQVRPPQNWLWGAAMLATVSGAILASGPGPADLVVALLMYVPPFGFGVALRLRSERSAEQARRAVADERARIARELHDIVAHSLSVVTLQTQALQRRLEPHQDEQGLTLREVEHTARTALVEMRRLLGVVRGGHVPFDPQPSLARLEELLDETRHAGLSVESTVTGDLTALNPGVDLAGYRIVQEALTNVRRHARATRTWVSLRCATDVLEIDVRDNGTGPARVGRTGHGLIGMRERALLYGGELQAGPADGGGFRVRALLPVEAGA